MHAMLPLLQETDFPPLRRGRLKTIQVNLGYRCNQQCLHCHVNAGPNRSEQMSDETVEHVLRLFESGTAENLDLTGGAPELHPRFRYLVAAARKRGAHVIDRCNLTVLEEPGQEDLASFLARHAVEVVASLPCYLEQNVEAQRGKGVFAGSIAGLKRLNAVGYGRGGLLLNLVYNPPGPVLPPPQQALEADYKRELQSRYGIVFDRLLTIANMPIQRFGSALVSRGELQGYMDRLRETYSDANLAQVMCRNLVSIDWRGRVFDCDFNQMLGLETLAPGRGPLHVADLIGRDLYGWSIRVAEHCYGCTAGQGSSCGGALNGG